MWRGGRGGDLANKEGEAMRGGSLTSFAELLYMLAFLISSLLFFFGHVSKKRIAPPKRWREKMITVYRVSLQR